MSKLTIILLVILVVLVVALVVLYFVGRKAQRRQIAQKEQRLKELEDELCNITDLPRIQSLTTEYEKLKFELDSLMNEWEKLAE